MISSDRRVFLHAAGAALALPLAGVDVLAGVNQEKQRQKRDPVLAEIVRQSKGAFQKTFKAGLTPSAEAARQHASGLRLLAAHGGAIGIDATLTKNLRVVIAQQGRTAIVARRPDVKALIAQAKGQGLDVDPSRLSLPIDADTAARSAALNAVLRGATQTWLDVAASLERIGDRLDQERGVHLVRRQVMDCTGLQFMMRMIEFNMIATCALVVIPEVCTVFTLQYLAYLLYMTYYGC